MNVTGQMKLLGHALICACCTLMGCVNKMMFFSWKILRVSKSRPASNRSVSSEQEKNYITYYASKLTHLSCLPLWTRSSKSHNSLKCSFKHQQ